MDEVQFSESRIIIVTNCKVRVREGLLTFVCAYAALLYQVIVS